MPSHSLDLATIKRQVLLRYRAAGHARFQLPPALCAAQYAEGLLHGLRASDGVYRVDWQPGQGKLSVRYREADCDFRTVAQALGLGIERVWQDGLAQQQAVVVAEPSQASQPVRWLRGKYQELRETLQAMRVLKGRLAQHAGNTPAQRERFLLEFFNDVLVLYLTKIHWNAITTQWMRYPWRHRYEWLAAFYMVYLLVRWRRSKPR
jgi:hypothetical protein